MLNSLTKGNSIQVSIIDTVPLAIPGSHQGQDINLDQGFLKSYLYFGTRSNLKPNQVKPNNEIPK